MHKIMAQRGKKIIFCDNENFERGPPRHAGGNGNQDINFVWPYHHTSWLLHDSAASVYY